MKLSMATVCLSGDLEEKLHAIAAAGFKGAELFENDLLSFNGKPTDIRQMIDGLGLNFITLQPFRDFEGLPAEWRDRVFQRAERKFDVRGELGCDLLMVCSNVSPESLDGIDRAAADLHELGVRAALDRAQKLLDRPFRQALGPGELQIPAVRGLGNSLVYFTDQKTELARGGNFAGACRFPVDRAEIDRRNRLVGSRSVCG